MNANNSEVLYNLVNEQSNKVKEKEEEIEQLKHQLTECKNQNLLKEKQIEQTKQKLLNVEKSNREKSQKIDRLNGYLNDRAQQAQKINLRLYEKDGEIEKLKGQINQLKENSTFRVKWIEDSDTYIQKNQNVIQEKDKDIKRLKKQLCETKDKLGQNLIEKEQQITKLKKNLMQSNSFNMLIKKNEEDLKILLQDKYKEIRQRVQENKELNKLLKDGKHNFQNLKKTLQNESKKKQRKIVYENIGNIKYTQVIKIDSLVLRTQSQIQTLVKILGKKKLVGFRLLFRASDYGFDVKYKEKYCGVSHTVLLAKTHYGKIIGGYTPLKWKVFKGWFGQKINHQEWEKDILGETFIFSITNNHKLTLKSPLKNSAIQHDNDCGPIFRRGICINNNSNTQKKSSAFYWDQMQYINSEYKSKDKDSHIKFVGSQDGGFYTQQWQVHEVIFQEQLSLALSPQNLSLPQLSPQ